MINANDDSFIQKDEIEAFVQKQKSPSVFNDYFNSIQEPVSINDFAMQVDSIIANNYETTGQNPEIGFKNKKDEEEYKRLTLDEINNMRDEAYQFLGYKTSNKEAFNALFANLLKEAVKEGDIYKVLDKLEALELTEPVSMEYIKESNAYDVTLPIGVPLSANIDWSNSREVFDYLSFDKTAFSNTPPEHLPEGYNPQQVLEKGKTIGLGIDEVHEMGYTGEGVSYAIIDSGVAKHQDIKFKEYHVSQYAQGNPNHYHGSVVSYIAQEIAPNADCYYYAQHNGNGMDAPVLDNLKQILEKNKTLPDNQKIRFVSMSMPLYGGEEAKQVVKELEAQGVWVFYSRCPEDRQLGYLGKKDPMGDTNDFNNYQIEAGSSIGILPDGTQERWIFDDKLYVNSGDRTVPDPSSPTAYRHDSRASQSWSVPVLAGYYTLACQADSTMTKEKFLKLAEQTAQVKQSTMPINEFDESLSGDNCKRIGRTEETIDIKIIDIKALLEAIEAQKQQ